MFVKPIVASARVVGSDRLSPENAVGMVSSCVGGGSGLDDDPADVDGRGSRGRLAVDDADG